MLIRWCAPGGEGPKELVEIIRSRVEDVWEGGTTGGETRALDVQSVVRAGG